VPPGKRSIILFTGSARRRTPPASRYEVTHPGERLTDPYCQPQPGEAGHGHARSAPTRRRG
jgi:hypothetical protein